MITFFLPLLILLAGSFVIISSISVHLAALQALWLLVGIAIVIFFIFIDWRSLLQYEWVIYGLYAVSIFLLLFVLVKGPVIRNVRSWIVIGPLTFQPVEIAKVSVVLLYAYYFSRRHLAIARYRILFISLVFCLAAATLTALQPALGSAIILFGIWFGFVVFSGLPFRRFLAAMAAFAVAGALLWFWGLRPYQKERIVAIFYPQHVTLDVNYSTIQSKIALGSAGFWGKGYRQGSQTQLGFLTEPESDFVLAAFVEEWGWGAGLVLLAAFCFLVIAVLRVGMHAQTNFERLVCLGTALVFGLQFFLNTGSTTGILPVVGVTFPFVSYGGTSLASNFFLIAIVNAIRRNR